MNHKIQLLSAFFIFIINSFSFAHVGLSYPNGGEYFNPGDEVDIKWYVEIDHGDCAWDLYYSINNGLSWQEIITGLSKSQLNYSWKIPDSLSNTACKIQVVQNNVSYNNYSDQCPEFNIGIIAGVVSERDLPNKFVVFPAYPNPFNNSTIISFNISEPSNVELNIYNIAGQKMETLLNKHLSGGLYKILWKADNLSSGIYFYEVKTNRNAQIKKVILLK